MNASWPEVGTRGPARPADRVWRIRCAGRAARRLPFLAATLAGILALWSPPLGLAAGERRPEFAGSASCRECHADFHDRWASSLHGRSVQAYADARSWLAFAAPTGRVVVATTTYDVKLEAETGEVIEAGSAGTNRFQIEQVIGGRSVCYFLAGLAQNRLQVLPVAYDLNRREWFSPAVSALESHAARNAQPLDWRSDAYTFNLSCAECHVSQVRAHYDPEAGGHRSQWSEPGINCEACHGPAAEHVRLCRALAPGERPTELAILTTRGFDHDQINAMCAPCHAKQAQLTGSFQSGDRFFDHYDLATLEDPAFHPDGRDAGENYTYTSWQANPCARSNALDCLHCHTSSGRYRFTEVDANAACLPCHERQVRRGPKHTHHPATSAGNRCVSCHLPPTEFARMRRHDHSFRPPIPAATRRFGSPNACNQCHADRDVIWAESWVRRWHGSKRQERAVRKAEWIVTARRQDWTRLEDMLGALRRERDDGLFVASLVGLLRSCEDDRKWPALVDALGHPSPLVRSRAASGLTGHLTGESVVGLLRASRDPVRLVRVYAARALAALPPGMLSESAESGVRHAATEFETAMRVRWGDAGAQAELGFFRLDRGDPVAAAEAFELALTFDPGNIAYRVSAATAWHRAGQVGKAEAALRRALRLAPQAPEVYRNLGRLLAGQGRLAEEQTLYEEALRVLPATNRIEFAVRLRARP